MVNSGLTDAQDQLHQFMSEISELVYCAGWMTDTEYRLWTFVTDPNDDGEWGLTILTPETRFELIRRSEQIGGWICWADVVAKGAGAGPKFIDLAEWQEDYAVWVREKSGAI